jgi:anti-anti-sigma factor
MTLGDVQISLQDTVVVAELTGEVDLSNARAIEEAIVVATPNHATRVVIDLSRLDYLDSAGIQLVYQLREKLQVRGQELRLVVPDRSAAADALTLAGVTAHLDIFQTVAGADADADEAE